MCSDGIGGAIISWQDLRNGNTDIYAQRVNLSGATQWLSGGVVVCTAGNNQFNPQLISDGSSGAIVTWSDYRSGSGADIYAQRLHNSSTSMWIPNGIATSTAIDSQINPQLVSDSANGAIITWQDFRNGTNHDIYAQRLLSDGILAGAFPYSSGTPVPTGANLTDVFAADIDKDGDQDVIDIHDTPTNAVTIRKNNNDGTLADGVNVTGIGSDPFDVATGDFDRDGDIDIAAAVWNAHNVRILTNNGSGTFTNTSSIAVPDVDGAAAADFNGDGYLDIAASSYTANTAYVSLGSSGGFGAASAITGLSGTQPVDVLARDFDRDGDVDLALASVGNHQVQIATNGGSANFTAGTVLSIGAGTSPGNVQSADFDSDGDLDLAVVESDNSRVSIWQNTGGTSFAASGTYTTTSSPRRVSLGDVNGDGKADLTVGGVGLAGVSTFLGNGDGTFGSRRDETNGGTNTYSATLADMDKDGDLDRITANNGSSDIRVMMNQTIHRSVLYTAPVTVSAGGDVRNVVCGDLNRDGRLDIATANQSTGGVSVIFQNVDGTYAAAVNVATGSTPTNISTGDLDKDGDLDLIVGNQLAPSVSLLRNDGAGVFTEELEFSTDAPTRVVPADVDRDGDLDLVVNNAGTNSVSIYQNNGAFSFPQMAGSPYSVGTYPNSVVVADLDKDGDLDFATANYTSNDVSVRLNNGSGGFATATGPFASGNGSRLVAAADMDGDGDLDLATANDIEANVSVLLNNGSATAFAKTNYATGAGAFGIAAGDVDADGRADLVVTNRGVPSMSLLRNSGGGAFAAAVNYNAGDEPIALVLADTDRDGDLDAVIANNTATNASVLVNRGGQFALATTDTSPASVNNNTRDDVLKVIASHRGISGDTSVELSALHLRFDNGSGTPLTSAQANAIIEDLEIWLDLNGDGIWQQAQDFTVRSEGTITLDASGEILLSIPDGSPQALVPFGTPKTYFVVLNTTPNAGAQTPSACRVTHLTSASSKGDDPISDYALVLEYAANTATPAGGTPLPVTLSGFELE